MEPLSRWRAAALAFFLTIGLSGVFAVVPFVGGPLSAIVGSIGLLILIPLIVLAPQLVPLVDDGSESDRRPPVSEAEPATRSTRAATTSDPVEDLRDRYANGEISQTEFERRLDDLLATEDLTLGDGGSRADGHDEDGRRSGAERGRRERERN